MSVHLLLSVLLFTKDLSRPSAGIGNDDLKIDASIVSPQVIRHDDVIRLRGTFEFKKSAPPSCFFIVIWSGGRPGTGSKASEAVVEIASSKLDQKNGVIAWEGSIRANYAGDKEYYLEVLPLHGDDADEPYYDVNRMKISWVKRIEIEKK